MKKPTPPWRRRDKSQTDFDAIRRDLDEVRADLERILEELNEEHPAQ